jgi:hypothetical protein
VSYLLSTDVTDPTAEVTLVDSADGSVIGVHPGGLEFATIESVGDGVSRLVTVDGKQLEQYPGMYARFSEVAGTGAYGRCSVEGVLVAFKTRPEDQAFTYTVKRLP